MTAHTRYVCRIGPRGDVWSDFAYEFAREMQLAGEPFRILPIGAAVLQVLAGDPAWRHWRKLRNHFTGELAIGYDNIVCCELGTMTGRRLTAGQLAPARPPELDQAEIGREAAWAQTGLRAQGAAAASRNEVIYEPEYALAAYRVEGHANIAITGSATVAASPAEFAALKRYDQVRAPHADVAGPLSDLGIAHQVSEKL